MRRWRRNCSMYWTGLCRSDRVATYVAPTSVSGYPRYGVALPLFVQLEAHVRAHGRRLEGHRHAQVGRDRVAVAGAGAEFPGFDRVHRRLVEHRLAPAVFDPD